MPTPSKIVPTVSELFIKKNLLAMFPPGSLRYEIDNAGEAWFVVTDVCKALGYANAAIMTQAVEDTDKRQRTMRHCTNRRTVWQVKEHVVYRWILRGKSRLSVKLQTWISESILPSLSNRLGLVSVNNEPSPFVVEPVIEPPFITSRQLAKKMEKTRKPRATRNEVAERRAKEFAMKEAKKDAISAKCPEDEAYIQKCYERRCIEIGYKP